MSHEEVYVGETEDSRPAGRGTVWNKLTGQKLFCGNWNGYQGCSYAVQFKQNTIDHPAPEAIGKFWEKKQYGHGLAFHENGKMCFRGEFRNDTIDDSRFSLKFDPNGTLQLFNFDANKR